VNKSFKKLSSNQRNWRPNAETWSLNDIFWHLNTSLSYYNTEFIEKIEKTKFKQSKDTFISSPLGRSAWKSMKLGNAHNVKRKFRAPKEIDPKQNQRDETGNELEIFLENQHTLLEIFIKAAEVNLRKVKIPLSISKMVRLRLGDCLQFVVYHNERHYYQALNLINLRGFPTK
jgi:hypothetical protein